MTRRSNYWATQACTVDGCRRDARDGMNICDTHYNQRRNDAKRSRRNQRDWVLDSAGPECRVCGRSVYEHGVTEFCEGSERRAAS